MGYTSYDWQASGREATAQAALSTRGSAESAGPLHTIPHYGLADHCTPFLTMGSIFTFTFSNLADAFVRSDVQGRVQCQSSYGI